MHTRTHTKFSSDTQLFISYQESIIHLRPTLTIPLRKGLAYSNSKFIQLEIERSPLETRGGRNRCPFSRPVYVRSKVHRDVWSVLDCRQVVSWQSPPFLAFAMALPHENYEGTTANSEPTR